MVEFESLISTAEEKNKHIERIVRSKPQIIEVNQTLKVCTNFIKESAFSLFILFIATNNMFCKTKYRPKFK